MPSDKFFKTNKPVRPHLVRAGGGLSGEIRDLRRDVDQGFANVEGEALNYHEPTITASRGTSRPGQGPTLLVYGATLVLQFTPTTDEAFRIFKIPYNYLSDAAFHVHWTKTGDLDESGKNVRWRLEYNVWAGDGGDLSATAAVEVEDTYMDNGLTTRLSERTANNDLVGFVAGRYVSMRLTAVAPTGPAMSSEPGLVSLDLTYRRSMNVNEE